MADPVGLFEIAQRLDVSSNTPPVWRRRGLMPAPTWPSVSGHPAWEWSEVLRWAGETGRLRTEETKAEFKRMTGREALPERRGGILAANGHCPTEPYS